MNWDGLLEATWPKPIDNLESKQKIAAALAAQASDGDVIGIGSGSTSFLALLALRERIHDEGLTIRAIPTSLEIESYCAALGLPLTTLVAAAPDWCFDGADEIDRHKNMIKGRGGAFVREMLVFAAAKRRIILADPSKFVDHLGENFSVPLAVVPEAANLVISELSRTLGFVPQVRPAGGKDGGVINESGSLVMDLPIDSSVEPAALEATLLCTPGIAATGLFIGFDYEIIS